MSRVTLYARQSMDEKLMEVLKEQELLYDGKVVHLER